MGGAAFEKDKENYNLSGKCGITDVNEYIFSACEWNSAIGPTGWAKLKYNLTFRR